MQEGDRSALLAAINDAAANMGGSKKATPSQVKAQNHGTALMKNSNVNQHIARDLVSNANSRVADMNDFAGGSAARNGTKMSAE